MGFMQGRMILDPITRRIQEGKGDRNIYCPFYSGCLDQAAKKNWQQYHCEGCPEYLNRENPKEDLQDKEEIMKEKKRATKVCKKCNQEKDLEEDFHINNALKDRHENICKKCKSEKSKEYRQKKKKNIPKPSVSTVPPPAEKEQIPPPGKHDASLILDLTEYPDVLRSLPSAAKTHIRTLQHQAIAYIVAGLQKDGYAEPEIKIVIPAKAGI